MYELKVTVTKVMGNCDADPPMKPGDSFTVSDGDIRIPEGGHICIWALQSLIPLLTPKEREIAEKENEDWMWRVHHVQCPDPDGLVIFKIERTGRLGDAAAAVDEGSGEVTSMVEGVKKEDSGILKTLQVVVESVNGKCTSCMEPGDSLTLRSGRIYLPPGGHFCLYALQAVLPLLPAKQRILQDGDWMKVDSRVICPDPAGNVIMRIDREE